MALRIPVQLNDKVRTALHPLITRLNNKFDKIHKFVAQKFEGTIVERWGVYWKSLFLDYKEVAIDTVNECKRRPLRAAVYTSVLGTLYLFYKKNPNEDSFRANLLQNSTKIMQVGEAIRNPISESHVRWLEQCYNEGIIRRLSLGVVSFIWTDNYDKDCSTYKAICYHLKPRYLTFHERIVDVGFMDKWWILEKKMKNYDINEEEFKGVPP